MNKRISIGAAVALVILAATLTVSLTMVIAMRQFNAAISDLNKRQAEYAYLVDVDKAIRQHYYGTIDEERLQFALAKGMADGLDDPYAAYLSADDYREALARQSGAITGLGVEIAENRVGQKVVTLVYADSPAEKMGLPAGSILKKINDDDAAKLSLSSARKKLRTAEAALLTVELPQGGEASFKLSAAPVEMTAVTGQVTDGIAYLRIRAFRDNTPAQFRAVFDRLVAEGAVAFIYDVRDNDGGSIESLQAVLNYLLPSGRFGAILDNTGAETPLTADGGHTARYPAAVLINGQTDGEAVMFAAVMQACASATTVGTTTAGRATVLNYYPNRVDGAAIRFSTGKMMVLTEPAVWEKVGLEPVMEAENYAAESLVDLIEPEVDHPLSEAIKLMETAIGRTETVVTTTTDATDPTETVTTSTTSPRATPQA